MFSFLFDLWWGSGANGLCGISESIAISAHVHCRMKAIHPTSHRRRFSVHHLNLVFEVGEVVLIYIRTYLENIPAQVVELEPSPSSFGTIRYPPTTHPIIDLNNWKFSLTTPLSPLTVFPSLQFNHIISLSTSPLLYCTAQHQNEKKHDNKY